MDDISCTYYVLNLDINVALWDMSNVHVSFIDEVADTFLLSQCGDVSHNNV